MSTDVAPNEEVQNKYVARLRARLARPKITVQDARDGMLDCYVSTYHAGVEHGLKGILGVDASPDQVAQLAGRMFRDRLSKQGLTFDHPTVDALSNLKDELDEEFHFSELPVEVSATHDQVCSLLLAKAGGLIEHDGDRTVVRPPHASNDTPSPGAATARQDARAARPHLHTQVGIPKTPTTAPVHERAPIPLPTDRLASDLRRVLASYLDETSKLSETATAADLVERLARATKLVDMIAEVSPTGA